MASGYLAMSEAVETLINDVPALRQDRKSRDWFFTPLLARLAAENATLATHLDAGSSQFLRIAQLDHRARTVAWIVAAVLAAVVGTVLWAVWDIRVSLGWLVLAAAGLLAAHFAPALLGRWSWTAALVDPLGELRSQTRKWTTAFMTWTIARWLVPRLTQRYLDAGRISVLGP